MQVFLHLHHIIIPYAHAVYLCVVFLYHPCHSSLVHSFIHYGRSQQKYTQMNDPHAIYSQRKLSELRLVLGFDTYI